MLSKKTLSVIWLVVLNRLRLSSCFEAPSASTSRRSGVSEVLAKAANDQIDSTPAFAVQVNEFFRRPVPSFIREYLENASLEETATVPSTWETIVSPPTVPGVPRPLWIVILASVPTGLVWYGYYKFCVEEELLQTELELGRSPRGYGGYGTLGPFCYGLALGPLAELLHIPGGILWSNAGILFIYYTQFLLYDRVNQLYRDEQNVEGGSTEVPLSLWWTLPIFFPFNLIVGLRQVHFLSQYWYRQRGIDLPPEDPVVSFFPFIGADRFTWQDFVTTPSLWCSLLKDIRPIDRSELPDIVQSFLCLGEKKGE